MGVKGLYTYLKPYRQSILPDMVDAARIGIDAMSLIYKYKSEYKVLFPYLEALKHKGHKMTFIFDGKAPAAKEEEINDRRTARAAADAAATALKVQLDDVSLTPKEREILEFSVSRFEHQGWHLSREVRHDVQAELTRLDIPWLKAAEEADTVLVEMVKGGQIDVVMSTDMDFILSGVSRLWIPGRDSYEELLLADIMHGEGLTASGIRDAGILCGVEPLRGKISVPPKVSFGWLRHYGTLEALLARRVDLVALDPLRVEGELERVRGHFQ